MTEGVSSRCHTQQDVGDGGMVRHDRLLEIRSAIGDALVGLSAGRRSVDLRRFHQQFAMTLALEECLVAALRREGYPHRRIADFQPVSKDEATVLLSSAWEIVQADIAGHPRPATPLRPH